MIVERQQKNIEMLINTKNPQFFGGTSFRGKCPLRHKSFQITRLPGRAPRAESMARCSINVLRGTKLDTGVLYEGFFVGYRHKLKLECIYFFWFENASLENGNNKELENSIHEK